MTSTAITVGVDVGTTSVKALAVDGDGTVVARTRIPHKILSPAADQLEHDAKAAWRNGPRRALAELQAEVSQPIAGVAVAAMVPSLTAVDRRGIPRLPGLLYGDARGQPPPGVAASAHPGAMPDSEWFLRWAIEQAPDARGYWPCQAVAAAALSGIPAIDSTMTISMGALYDRNGWNADLLSAIGARPEQMPVVVPMCEAAGNLPGSDTVIAGGSVDALCDQIVAGAREPGDVLAIFGATLIVWVVSDEWVEIPGLITIPHTVAGRVLIGGPSNAGALFVDWARRLLRLPGGPGPEDLRPGQATGVPVWLPYVRGERTPFNDASLRASVHALDITQGPVALERGVFEASGFVIRRVIERSGVTPRRVVASGGGTNVRRWMAAVSDATGLPVDLVAVPEGAALGAAFLARMAAGLETAFEASGQWASVGARVEPDSNWVRAASERFARFEELGPRLD